MSIYQIVARFENGIQVYVYEWLKWRVLIILCIKKTEESTVFCINILYIDQWSLGHQSDSVHAWRVSSMRLETRSPGGASGVCSLQVFCGCIVSSFLTLSSPTCVLGQCSHLCKIPWSVYFSVRHLFVSSCYCCRGLCFASFVANFVWPISLCNFTFFLTQKMASQVNRGK